MPDKDPNCIFCRIAHREIHAHTVYEDEAVLAFLDRGPIRPGHTQIIPKRHFHTFDDLPAHVAANLVEVGQRLARVMNNVYGLHRVAFVFTGGDIAHAHAHVVPMHEATDITSRRTVVESELTFRPMPTASTEELEKEALRLIAGLTAS